MLQAMNFHEQNGLDHEVGDWAGRANCRTDNVLIAEKSLAKHI
jgi:hypothetical protein